MSWMSWILAWRPSTKKALRASELFHVHVISSVEPLACNKNMLTWTWHHRTFHYIDILFFPPSLTLQQGQGGYGNRSQSSRLAESQLMFQPDGSNNQQAGNSDVETQNEKARISNRMFPRSWKKECCAEWLVKCMSSFEFVEIDMSHWHWLIVFRVKESETRKTYLLQRLKSTPAHLDALTLSSWLASFFCWMERQPTFISTPIHLEPEEYFSVSALEDSGIYHAASGGYSSW